MAHKDGIKKESCVPVMTLRVRNAPSGFPTTLEVEMPMHDDVQQVKQDVEWLKKYVSGNTILNAITAVTVVAAVLKLLGLY
jgi:hypothetical protein